jgi:hypothetical protein
VVARARLSWSDGREVGELPARLVDISRGGAQIETGRPLRPGQAVRVRLEGPGQTGWAAARVIWARGPRRAGVAFEGGCPFEFYHAAFLGLSFGHLFRGG